MFNSGVRGRRAPDNFGTLSSQTKYIQQKSPQPSITSWSIVGTDDTALNTAGGQTVLVNGTGFASGAAVTVNGQTISPVTVVSPTQLSFTSIALAGGSYSLIVYNSTGGAAILVPGLIYSAVPTWTTSAGSIGTTYETTPISTSVVATSDSAITYSLSSGSLPSGATLYANGVITGTSPVESGSTTYTFAIKAEDAELQDTTRTFTLTINTDVVTWSAPANNTSYTANINEVASNVVLSATSAAGYGITYSANTLPTGLSLAGNTISGTPTVVANSSTLLTATASTTNRSATRTINWIIQLGSDPYFYLTTLLLNGETSSNYWIQDASTNKFALTVNADTRPTAFSPYETVWSNQFDGTGDYLTAPSNSAFAFGTEDFTVEGWYYLNSGVTRFCLYDSGSGGSGGQFAIFQDSATGFFVRMTSDITFGSPPPPGQWTHFAVTRAGTTVRLFFNGTQAATGTQSTNVTNTTPFIGFMNGFGSYIMNGYISNLRVVNGTAVYTTNFTPPTSPLTAITNTVLLTCQSNRLLDNSTNNFTVTKNGDVSVSNFGPFAETDLITGSGYFDGAGDFIDAGNNSAFAFGTGDFTVECWIFTAVASDSPIYEGRANGSTSDGFTLTAFSSSVIRIFSGSALISSSGTNYLNQWTHIAVCRISSVTTLYINGVSIGTSVSLGNNTTGSAVIGGGRYGGGTTVSASFTGYISNFRIIKGTAVYTSAFTPPTSPLTAIANTSLLTLQNRFGENNNRFVDTSGMNSIVTKFANATQGTFSPFSQTGWSGYFDGTTDSLTQATNSSYGFDTGNFTIEFWLYLNSTGLQTVYSNLTSASSTNPHIYISGSIRYYTASADRITGSSLNTSQWYHIALSRESGSTRLFINGTQSGSTYTDGNNYGSTAPLGIGTYWDGGSPVTSNTLFGYVSNLRVVKGTAVYTTNFTSPTSPLTAIANTSVLTCQSNRFIDNSANNFTLTRNGDISIQAFSPFSPAIITPTSYSGYFDGSDNLTTPSNNAFTYGTSDFTVEGWFYFTGGVGPSGYSYLFAQGANTTATSLGVYIQSGVFRIWNGSAVISSTASFVQNIWTHIAVTRFGTSMRLFVNGNLEGTVTNNNNITTGSTTGISIGRWSEIGDANYITGYVSNFRVVNGTALYTASFTPSITPLTAVSGTSLLACQSNRFIDNSINNFTITAVGDVRATQFNPFGNTSLTGADAAYSLTNVGGSTYFDGTGDYLTATTSFNTSTTWTIEGWCYFTSSANNDVFICASSDRLYIQWLGTTFYLGDASVNNISFASKPVNTWFHLAVVKNSSTYTAYFNGVVMGTSTTALITDTVTTWQIGARTSQSIVARGYISNLRVIAGVALYTSAFAPPVAPLTSIAGSTLLLNSTNSGLIDYTSKNNLETVGNAQLSAAITKFGNASIYFDGSGDYLTVRTSPLLDFGTGNFTVEFWWYPTTVATDQGFLGGGSGCYDFVWRTSTGFNLGRVNVAFDNTFAFSPVVNTWYHVAYSRSGTSLRVFVNGTQVGSTATNSISYGTNGTTAVIGGSTTGDRLMTGYIDDLRITNGFARYTANFTPPTSAFITF
jgi:hypothetical protein